MFTEHVKAEEALADAVGALDDQIDDLLSQIEYLQEGGYSRTALELDDLACLLDNCLSVRKLVAEANRQHFRFVRPMIERVAQ